jgi:AcrR family transcriptional regulator
MGSGTKAGSPRSRGEDVAGRPRRKRRGSLSPEAITRSAIRIADREGLEAVSIRRLAAALDARTMSIYDHISNKEELLSLMGQEVVAEVLVEGQLPEDWRQALSTIARRMYAMIVRHPWLVAIFTRVPRIGANSTRQAQQYSEAMAALALGPSELWVAVGTLNDYVLGHSHRAVSMAPSDRQTDLIPAEEISKTPELASLPAYLRTRASVERFEAGLAIVLDGIERWAGRARSQGT